MVLHQNFICFAEILVKSIALIQNELLDRNFPRNFNIRLMNSDL